MLVILTVIIFYDNTGILASVIKKSPIVQKATVCAQYLSLLSCNERLFFTVHTLTVIALLNMSSTNTGIDVTGSS